MTLKLCPCHSKKPYQECCQPFHEGSRLVENALQLMRSRYSAYALGLADYIIQTTYSSKSLIKKDIASFCQNTDFQGLDIVEFIDGKDKAYVTFVASLQQIGKDASFREKSEFLKINEKWFYTKPVI